MLELNNFDEAEQICNFQEGQYYKFVALARAKDFDEKHKSVLTLSKNKEYFIKQWFVENKEQLEKYKPDMVALCNVLKCRLYMAVDAKSLLRTVHTMSLQINRMLVDTVENPEAVSLRKLAKFSASASQMEVTSVHAKRKWLIDFDLDKAENKEYIYKLMEQANVLLKPYNSVLLKTPNGYHIVCDRKMDAHSFLRKHLEIKELPACVEIKENALTLIYYYGYYYGKE